MQAGDDRALTAGEPWDMSEPTVTALGHAGLRLDAPGIRLLADPWLSQTGAFLGAWFPFPGSGCLHRRAMGASRLLRRVAGRYAWRRSHGH